MNPTALVGQMGLFALWTLIVDAIPLVMAALYAARPSESRLALMRPFSLAALFAGIAGTLVGLVNVLMGVSATFDMTGRWPRAAAGLSEALVPVVFGLTCLTLAWLLVAVGMWRGVREG